MPTSKIARSMSTLENLRIPVKDVREIVATRIKVVQTQMCDEFHVILRRLQGTTKEISDAVYQADSQGSTISYGQLYTMLNMLHADILAGETTLTRLRDRTT